MSKNNWQSYRHEEVDSWKATFKDSKMHDLSLILAFLTGVLEAGERERVLMIEEDKEAEFPYHKSMGISYAQHMNNVFEQHGKILPVTFSYGLVSHLCYYDIDGNLTEGDVDNVGTLLSEVVPYDELKNYQWSDNSPLASDFDYYPPDYHTSDGTIFHLNIYTKTDIWQPEIHYGGTYDNLELAMCHTPRLNRFITEFKLLTLEFGGEWGNPDYPNAQGRDGIILS